ncbi:hypothetical protein STENM223S_02573 [Streptomyces tendae]
MSLLPGPVRRFAAWCAVILLASGVVYVAIRLCVELRTAVTPALLALLGTALLQPLHRRMVKAHVQRSLAAGLTCAAVLAVVGGAVYIVVSALVETGDQIVASLRDAAKGVAEHFGAAGTSLDDVASNARELLGKFGGTAASGVARPASASSARCWPWPCWPCCSSSSSCATPTGPPARCAPSPRRAPPTRSRPWPGGRSGPSRASCGAPP